tara:strand:+ start:442 stop:1476 length:1035 start_codon:yes stop_codon:yes gene_type:complete
LKNIFYFSIKYLLRYYNQVFFREIKVYGYENIPSDGGVLLSPNHQSALLDPLLVGSMTPKKMTSLTRSDIFGGPLQWFLEASQTLPVYRIRNGYSNLKKNDAIFDQCYKLLGKGKFLLMFSEGGHHDEYFLQRLSKGSSRLAYNAQLKNPGKKIYLQPIGLNYGHHRQVRCDLHMVYGTPIEVGKQIDLELSEAENINAIREELQKRMRDCLWLPDKTENYQTQKESINRLTTQLGFQKLRKLIASNFDQLPKRRKLSWIRNIFALLLTIPNIIPIWITRRVIIRINDVVFTSSMKYIMGVFFFPVWWFLSSIPIAYTLGNSAMTSYLLICISSIFIRQRILLS